MKLSEYIDGLKQILINDGYSLNWIDATNYCKRINNLFYSF